MRTMALQWLFTAVAVLCASASFRVARGGSPSAPHAAAWRTLAWCLVLFAGNMLLMHAWGTAALRGGADSAVMQGYLRFAPAFNHSRSALWLSLCLVLVAMACFPRLAGERHASLRVAALGAGAVAGWLLGLGEGALVPGSHYIRVALGDTAELFAVMATLLVTLARGSVDRYLWTALSVFGCMVAINILWLAALSMVEDARVWSPSPFAMATYRTLLMAAMYVVVLRRLRAGRSGRPVGALLADSRAPVPTLSG